MVEATSSARIVLTTAASPEEASRMGLKLVEERLAACATLVPTVESIYRWKEKIETSSEVLALLKSTTWKYQLLEARILELHPYEVPEIISIRIDSGNLEYLRWIEQSVIL